MSFLGRQEESPLKLSGLLLFVANEGLGAALVASVFMAATCRCSMRCFHVGSRCCMGSFHVLLRLGTRLFHVLLRLRLSPGLFHVLLWLRLRTVGRGLTELLRLRMSRLRLRPGLIHVLRLSLLRWCMLRCATIRIEAVFSRVRLSVLHIRAGFVALRSFAATTGVHGRLAGTQRLSFYALFSASLHDAWPDVGLAWASFRTAVFGLAVLRLTRTCALIAVEARTARLNASGGFADFVSIAHRASRSKLCGATVVLVVELRTVLHSRVV